MTAIIIWGTDFQKYTRDQAQLRAENAGIVVPDEIAELLIKILMEPNRREEPDNIA
jgi:hypothetical protein